MTTDTRDGLEELPPRLAEASLRELVGRASFGHIRSVLRPVLTISTALLTASREYLCFVSVISTDTTCGFRAISPFTCSVLVQRSGSVDAALRGCEWGPASGQSRASDRPQQHRPSVLEIINNLLTNLRASVARDSEALINALGEFADHLPDFQKIDIMMFIVNKIPSQRGGKITKADNMLQSILLKSLLKSNTVENIEAIYTTLALLITELGSEETVCDILQLIL
ncbi:Uncharacterized protein OBRU01_13727, partial [Operophtera brumata]